MACSDYTFLIEAAQQEEFRDAIFCTFQNEMGGLTFAFLTMGAVGTYIYGKTGSVVMMFSLTLVLGGAILPVVAPLGVSVAILLLLFVLGFGPVVILRRAGRI